MPTMIFPGQYSSLEKIAAFVKKQAQASHFSENDICCIESAVDEACSNIIEHAYQGENIGTIECITSSIPGGITVALRDHGHPFKLDKYKLPNLKSPLRNRKTHGLGLYFIKKLMDTVDFSSDGSTNTLTLTKLRKTNSDGKQSEERCIE